MTNTRHNILTVVLAVVCCATIREAADVAEVCHSYLGCFSMGAPWKTVMRPVPAPQSPESIDAQFYLYTRNQPNSFLLTKLPNISLSGSDYDGLKPTFFITHGFLSNANKTWMSNMRNAILTRMDANIIQVNWAKGSTQYMQSVANTRTVGADIVRLVNVLLAFNNASTSRLHLIGHSLGAHVMSYVGKKIPNIARITALDPAQPGFEGYGPQVRLDKTDANFVEVIHTNARPFIPFLGLGIMSPVGHVDFYMNGGWDQPGCTLPLSSSNITSLYDIARSTIEEIIYIAECPHNRANVYFTASILNKNCNMWGHRVSPLAVTMSILTGGLISQYFDLGSCSKDSCVPVGLETINYPARGSFFVATKGKEPYCNTETDSSMAVHRSMNDLPGMYK